MSGKQTSLLLCLLFSVLWIGCARQPELAPKRSPIPLVTSAPSPSPTLFPPTPTSAGTATFTPPAKNAPSPHIEKQAEGYVFTDESHGYRMLLPGWEWIPFVPAQEDINTVFAAAEMVMPEVDVRSMAQLMTQANGRFRLFAFYTGQEVRHPDFAVNLNVTSVPLDGSYDLVLVMRANKAQLPKLFPRSELLDEVLKTNKFGAPLGILVIRNDIGSRQAPFSLIQYFIFFQTSRHALMTITFSAPLEYETLIAPMVEDLVAHIELLP